MDLAQTFTGIVCDSRAFLVIELYAVSAKKAAVTSTPMGWTVVPIFQKTSPEYVERGAFMVGCFEGAPNAVREPAASCPCAHCRVCIGCDAGHGGQHP